jgi:hypothetical protein
MQIRRIVPLAVAGVVAAGAFMPASAASAFKGPYDLSLLPDPTIELGGQIGSPTCTNVDPASVDKHPLTVPRAGHLDVVLDSPDPTGTGNTDWDLAILDKSGQEIGTSAGGTSHEEAVITLKAKTQVVIVACNLVGAPNGTVSYTLTR